MEDMKAQIERKIIATQLSDWCKNHEGIIFVSSLCSQERILRFQTPLLIEIFPNSEGQTGVWESGRFLMYEIYNGIDDFKITCSVSLKGLEKSQRKDCLKLIEKCGITKEAQKGLYFLREWDYPSAAGSMDKIKDVFYDFSEFEMPYFETELERWKDNHDYILKCFPDVSQETLPRNSLPEEILIEGGMKDILTNKYERNLTARKKCIAVHGTACKICGFDFGEVYGPEFAGKIEVHHKKPLYTIKEDYVVDPVNDLIPVCPNCHMIIHSKVDGFYTVEEVMEMVKRE